MSGGATAVMAAAAVAGAAIAYNNGQAQKKAAEKSANQAKQAAEQQVQQAEKASQQAEKASQQAEANAKKQEKAAAEATNRANTKRADTGAALDFATQAGKAGASGTMLTGPQGIDPATLNLSKNTLLGS